MWYVVRGCGMWYVVSGQWHVVCGMWYVVWYDDDLSLGVELFHHLGGHVVSNGGLVTVRCV